MENMIVTTAGRQDDSLKTIAKEISYEIRGKYVERRKKSIQYLESFFNDDVIVVGKNRINLYVRGEKEPLFFHPNSSSFRIKRIMKGRKDHFIEAAKLSPGMSVLDCTLGLASDSIVASFVVGRTGKVVGVEGNPYIAFLTKHGLKNWDSGIDKMNEAMRSIEVNAENCINYLKQCPDQSFDVIYLDPMFDEAIIESDGIKGIRKIALYEDLSQDVIDQAKRVARKRIVLKDHWKSERFERFSFQVHRRKTAKFHFGVIEIENE
jgi:Putative SAM-dependent methyltransferase